MLFRFLGFWVVRRAFRLLTADDSGPLATRLTREGKRVLLGAALTLALVAVGVIVLIAILIVAVT